MRRDRPLPVAGRRQMPTHRGLAQARASPAHWPTVRMPAAPAAIEARRASASRAFSATSRAWIARNCRRRGPARKRLGAFDQPAAPQRVRPDSYVQTTRSTMTDTIVECREIRRGRTAGGSGPPHSGLATFAICPISRSGARSPAASHRAQQTARATYSGVLRAPRRWGRRLIRVTRSTTPRNMASRRGIQSTMLGSRPLRQGRAFAPGGTYRRDLAASPI